MAATKARTSHFNAETITAGAGDEASTWQTLATTYAATVSIMITNGATGPTLPCQIQIEVANDYNGGSPTEPMEFGGPFIGNVANNGIEEWGGIELPFGVAAVRLVAGSNTDQDVVADADVSTVTAI